VDVGPETLSCTTLGELRVRDHVHLERPLRIGDPIGGHMVSGHVDGVGRIASSVDRGDAREIEIEAPPEVARTLVVKGSIAVDGISLTINAVKRGRFSITLIPHTLAVTSLGGKPVGARVNLEADQIAKQVEVFVTRHFEREPSRAGAGPVIGIPLPIRRPRKDTEREARRIRLPRKQPW
jgi:riboflavin synthase